MSQPAKVGIFYHSDAAGSVPSGVDSFVRGILRWAPDDLQYLLFGATSDPSARPVDRLAQFSLGGRNLEYLPLIEVSASAGKRLLPDTVRYMGALRAQLQSDRVTSLDVMDFHRIEPMWLFRADRRPRNLVLHQDMSVLREPGCDIKWRHAPAVYEFIERHTFNMADNICVVRESAVDRYRRLYPANAGKFRFVPTWYDPEIFSWSAAAVDREAGRAQVRARYGVADGCALLVFVGRFDRQKDPLKLLATIRELLQGGRPVHLLMIGDGVLRGEIEARIRGDGLAGQVTLAGTLGRTEIASILRGADAFVLSSGYEGMPIAVLEALGSGLPVVSTDVGELRRVVRDGVNGHLAADGSVAALAVAVAKTLDQRQEIAGAACLASVAEFRPEKVLHAIYAMHRQQAMQHRGERQ